MKRRNFLWYSCLSLAGCSVAKSNSISTSSSTSLPEKLSFAVTDAEGLEELQRDYEPFRAALAEVLETQIEFFPVDDLTSAAPAMLREQIDLTWAGPSEYVLLHARAQAIPLVALSRVNYRTAIIVHRDSGIKSLADLKGKTLDVWQIGGAASHLGAIKLLLDAGIDPSDIKIIDPKLRLGQLKTGEVDAASRALSRYLAMLEEEGLTEDEYPILAQGPLLPGDVFAVGSHIAPQVAEVIRSRVLQHQDKLMQAILASEELAKRFAGGTFDTARDENYDIIRQTYQAIGQEEVIQ